MRNRILSSIVVIVASAALTSVVLAGGDEPGLTPAAADQPAVERIDPGIAASFAIFRRAQRAGEALDVSGPFGANGALAREVDTAAGTVWIVPANDALCLRAEDAVGAAWACGPLDHVSSHGLILSLRDPAGASSSFGVAPDGAAGLALVADGSSQALAADEGVYGITGTPAEASVSFAADGMTLEEPIP